MTRSNLNDSDIFTDLLLIPWYFLFYTRCIFDIVEIWWGQTKIKIRVSHTNTFKSGRTSGNSGKLWQEEKFVIVTYPGCKIIVKWKARKIYSRPLRPRVKVINEEWKEETSKRKRIGRGTRKKMKSYFSILAYPLFFSELSASNLPHHLMIPRGLNPGSE